MRNNFYQYYEIINKASKNVIAKNPETKKIVEGKGGNMYHHSLLKKYVSAPIFEILIQNKSLRNTIRCLNGFSAQTDPYISLDTDPSF